MAFNKTFNQEEVARLKKLIQEGDQVLYEVDSLQVGLRETVKAIAKAIEKTANKAIPSLWKSNKITSKEENIVTGISTEDNQIRFEIDVIGVTSITVNSAADKTANGYL